jgi:hypothetical protein
VPSASGISRRIEQCVRAIAARDNELALVNLFPAMDKTAKKRRPKDGVGSRIREFVRDEEGMISAIATGNILRNISVNGVDFPQAIYKFGRSAILHEGELDPRLQFNDSGSIQIGDVWNLPSAYITAMCVSVVAAPENGDESLRNPPQLAVFERTFDLNELWGQRKKIKELISAVFKCDDAVV